MYGALSGTMIKVSRVSFANNDLHGRVRNVALRNEKLSYKQRFLVPLGAVLSLWPEERLALPKPHLRAQ